MDFMVYPILHMVGLSVLGEASVEVIKDTSPKALSKSGKKMLSLAICVILAFALEVSVIEGGSTFANYTGMLLAGIISSRGSTYVHDMANMLEGSAKKRKV